MDISMPEQDGIESMRQILKATGCRVVILTVHLAKHHIISEAEAAGASGYLAKDSMDHELVSAVRTVVKGGTVFSANVSRRLAESAYVGPADEFHPLAHLKRARSVASSC